MPSEYLAVIQSGRTEDGDLVFEDMADAEQFTSLVMRCGSAWKKDPV